MKKILTLTVMTFLMLSMVQAISVGQNITQEQLDNIDLPTTDLEPNLNVFQLIGKQVYRIFSYLTVRKYADEDKYYVINSTSKLKTFPLEDYNICRTMYTKQECVDYYKIKSNIEMTKTHNILRDRIAKFQTQVDSGISELEE